MNHEAHCQRLIYTDLAWVFSWFPLGALRHARSHAGSFIRRAYTDSRARGCLLNYLSRGIEDVNYLIESRSDLAKFFSGLSEWPLDVAESFYEPRPQHLIQCIDARTFKSARYSMLGAEYTLSWEVVLEALDREIARRVTANLPSDRDHQVWKGLHRIRVSRYRARLRRFLAQDRTRIESCFNQAGQQPAVHDAEIVLF